jgi:hypothetical protein
VRKSRLAAAALAAALAAGCRRAPEPPADLGGGADLSAPAPSSSTVASPLDAGPGSFTNEMQAQSLTDQAEALGIRRLDKPSARSEDDDDGAPHQPITYKEGMKRTREMAREFETERHAIEGDKNKPVALPTETPGLLGDKSKDGAPLQ